MQTSQYLRVEDIKEKNKVMNTVVATIVGKKELSESFLDAILRAENEVKMEELLLQLEDEGLLRMWMQVKNSPIEALDEELSIPRTGSDFLSRAKMLLYEKSKEFQTK